MEWINFKALTELVSTVVGLHVLPLRCIHNSQLPLSFSSPGLFGQQADRHPPTR